MAYNETGHYKNVANFNFLIEYIISYGPQYVPSKQSIQLVNLQQLYLTASLQINKVQDAKNNYSQKVDNRENAFKDIKKFTTRIVANLSGTNVTEQTIKDAKTINAKIQIAKAKKPNNTNPEDLDPTSTSHSTSRQSYDSLYENFNDMISLLNAAQGYDTTQNEFSINELINYANQLKVANDEISNAIVLVTNKRIERNNLLYTPSTGLVDTALDAKKYIKGVFGATSQQFKTINSIQFKNKK